MRTSFRVIGIILIFLVGFISCRKKELLGPRKVTAVGHIEYAVSTGNLTTNFYLEGDDRIFTIKLKRNYTLGGDITGTWQHSGAQQLLFVDGDFGPNSPLPVDYGYYETRDYIAVPDAYGVEVNMRDFANGTYYVAVTHGYIGGKEYYRYFVFE